MIGLGPTAFEVMSKRRNGYPSERHVKRGPRVVHGDKEAVDSLITLLEHPNWRIRAEAAEAIGTINYEITCGLSRDRTRAEVSVADGVLTIHAERKEQQKEGRRTEFRYGSFTRSIAREKVGLQ